MIFYPVEGGFYLIDAPRASQRILYEALLAGRRRPVLLAPKAPWPSGLEERLGLLERLGVVLVKLEGWAVVKAWPEVPWMPRAHELREALKAVARIPPLAKGEALRILSGAFPYPQGAEPEPLVEALFSCREPERGPFGGLTAAFYSWEELARPFSL